MKDETGKKNTQNVPPKRPPLSELFHEKWKELFYETRQWRSYYPEEAHGVGGLSNEERKVLNKIARFEGRLRKLCEEFDIKLNESETEYDPVDGISRLYPNLVTNIKALLADSERSRDFSDKLHSKRKPGKVRVIPSFVAEYILLALAIHRMSEDTGERKEGYAALKKFLSKEGAFHLWFSEKFNSEELPEAFFSKDKFFITDWAKQLKQEMTRTIASVAQRKINKSKHGNNERWHAFEDRVRKKALKIRGSVKTGSMA
jgi:hypothetical protein